MLEIFETLQMEFSLLRNCVTKFARGTQNFTESTGSASCLASRRVEKRLTLFPSLHRLLYFSNVKKYLKFE